MREDRRLRRRELLARAGAAGLAALAADALPVVRAAARQLPLPLPPVPAVDPGGTLQAFADTMIPGRRVAVTESGAPVHPEAIAGVDPLPGAVETDALALYRHPKIGFGALAPAFLADLTARAGGRPFLTLPFDERVATCVAGLDFANPTRVLWEAAAAVPTAAPRTRAPSPACRRSSPATWARARAACGSPAAASRPTRAAPSVPARTPAPSTRLSGSR